MSNGMTPFEESDAPQAGEDQRAAQTPPRDAGWTDAARPRRWRSPGTWVGGAILILVGLVTLAQNMGLAMPILRNWWAAFIFIPAISSLTAAWAQYQRNGGRFTRSVSGSLIGGLAMVLVALTFLLDWSWMVIWPVFLILAGLGSLATGLLARR
jgi:hypothetical protein